MEFYGLIGEKLGHSLSPRIHKMILEHLNIPGAYGLFEIPPGDIDKLGEALKLLRIRGINVTMPYKQSVMTQLDHIAPETRSIGAVNTVLLSNGQLIGHNTDYFGFRRLLQVNKIDIKDKTAVVLGTGGASKAIQAVLADGGIGSVYLVTRQKSSYAMRTAKTKVQGDLEELHLYAAGNTDLAREIKVIDYQELQEIQGDILINATPVGMHPKSGISPVTAEVIDKYSVLVDVIYNPQETEFLRLGKKAGKQVCGGLYMLVAQAVKAQELWQEKEIDEIVIRDIYGRLWKEIEQKELIR